MERMKHTDQSSDDLNPSGKKPDFRDAIVEIREGVIFEQLLREQNYKPLSYAEFRKLADQIEWEHSLEELLAALD